MDAGPNTSLVSVPTMSKDLRDQSYMPRCAVLRRMLTWPTCLNKIISVRSALSMESSLRIQVEGTLDILLRDMLQQHVYVIIPCQYTTATASVMNPNSHVCRRHRAKVSIPFLQMQVNSKKITQGIVSWIAQSRGHLQGWHSDSSQLYTR